MTDKLYEHDSLLKSCSAKVTACAYKDGLYLVELDRTVLFPEGGGQLSDRGKIGDAIVSHVREKDGHIYHECDRALAVGSSVEAVIDWNVRLDRMQQHLGEHLLSYAFFKLFGANNIGFHMNEEMVTIDLDKELTDEDMLKAELFTNEIIWENRPVTVSYLDSEEAAKLKERMRKFNAKLTGVLRLVEVENADLCTCCGTHPPYTGMLGSVRVIRHEKHKGGCRVEFLCGKRALLDSDAKNRLLLETAAGLSVKPEQVPGAVRKIKADAAQALDAMKSKLLTGLEESLKNIAAVAPVLKNGARLVVLPMDGYDAKDIKALLPKLSAMPATMGVLVAAQPKRLAYAVIASDAASGDARSAIKLLNAAFSGRGGGKRDCAQGGSDYLSDWKERLKRVAAQLEEASL